jgi:hypothetical protein
MPNYKYAGLYSSEEANRLTAWPANVMRDLRAVSARRCTG